jgi:hypothetical protein
MTVGDRVAVLRCPKAGPGVLLRRLTNGFWMVKFENPDWPPRWAAAGDLVALPNGGDSASATYQAIP